MRSRFVSDRTAKPRHSSSFHSHVSFLLVILQTMSPSAHRMFSGFLISGVSPVTQRTSSPLVPQLPV